MPVFNRNVFILTNQSINQSSKTYLASYVAGESETLVVVFLWAYIYSVSRTDGAADLLTGKSAGGFCALLELQIAVPHAWFFLKSDKAEVTDFW